MHEIAYFSGVPGEHLTVIREGSYISCCSARTNLQAKCRKPRTVLIII
jgi:hypothetical protein